MRQENFKLRLQLLAPFHSYLLASNRLGIDPNIELPQPIQRKVNKMKAPQTQKSILWFNPKVLFSLD